MASKRVALLLLSVASVALAQAEPSGSVPVDPQPAAPARMAVAALPDNVDRQLDQLDREERAARRELDALAHESDVAHRTTLARGRAYVRLARAGLLPVGGGFEALVSHASRIERLHRALERDLARERRVATRRVELGKKLDGVRTRRAPLEVQQRAMAEARGALLAAQDRALAFEHAFSGSTGAHSAVYGATPGPADPAEVASGFAAAKGRLPFPLPGRAEIRSARRAASDGPGLEMRAPFGSPVRAVFTGRVAFADTYADYGRTVIVDHGGSFYTVSANLSELMVEAGDEVSTGTRLGSVGDTSGTAALYFEIRAGSETVDPRAWFGL